MNANEIKFLSDAKKGLVFIIISIIFTYMLLNLITPFLINLGEKDKWIIDWEFSFSREWIKLNLSIINSNYDSLYENILISLNNHTQTIKTKFIEFFYVGLATVALVSSNNKKYLFFLLISIAFLHFYEVKNPTDLISFIIFLHISSSSFVFILYSINKNKDNDFDRNLKISENNNIDIKKECLIIICSIFYLINYEILKHTGIEKNATELTFYLIIIFFGLYRMIFNNPELLRRNIFYYFIFDKYRKFNYFFKLDINQILELSDKYVTALILNEWMDGEKKESLIEKEIQDLKKSFLNKEIPKSNTKIIREIGFVSKEEILMELKNSTQEENVYFNRKKINFSKKELRLYNIYIEKKLKIKL